MKECPRCLACRDDGEEVCVSDDTRLVPTLQGSRVLDGKYRLEKRLGKGGMGLIYEARHVSLGRSFALKLIRLRASADTVFVSRFRVEGAALGRLKHPNIVDVTDFGVDPRDSGVPYLVMELLRGSSLADRLRREGSLELSEALPIFRSVAGAVDFAHQHGVLHRDLKPANVFLVAETSSEQAVKVLDFGISKLLGTDGDARPDETTLAESMAPSDLAPDTSMRLTQTGLILGSIPYMSPEIARAEPATPASDVYSFGVLIYESLVGRPPFEGTAEEILVSHSQEPPPVPSSLRASLSPELDGALLEPLNKAAEKRPRLAADVVAGLEAARRRIALAEWRRREIPRRLRVSLALGLAVTAVTAFVGRFAPLARLEEQTIDARFRTMGARDPDPRLLLISVDDATLEADPTPLPQKADEVGGALERLFRAGALAIGLDLLLPEAWNNSAVFSDLVLRHADRLTLAALGAENGATVGPEVLRGLTTAAMGSRRAGELFGLVNVGPDPDHVVRRARRFYRDSTGAERLAWATRVAASAGVASPIRAPEAFRIDYSADPSRLHRVSWKDLSTALEQAPALFANRVVLVGAEFSGAGDGLHPIPTRTGSPDGVSGLVLQALILNTLLRGLPFHDAPRLPILGLFAALSAGIAFGILYSRKPVAVGLAGLLSLVVYVALAFSWFERGMVLPVVEPIVIVLLTLAAAVALRPRLTLRPSAEGFTR